MTGIALLDLPSEGHSVTTAARRGLAELWVSCMGRHGDHCTQGIGYLGASCAGEQQTDPGHVQTLHAGQTDDDEDAPTLPDPGGRQEQHMC